MSHARGEDMWAIPVEAEITGSIVTSPTPNRPDWTARTVTVVTAGTPVQGPDVSIPNGFSVLIRQRVTQTGSRRLYVARTAANAGIAANRFEFSKGDGLRLFITNLNLLFFDTNTDGTIAELVVEQ